MDQVRDLVLRELGRQARMLGMSLHGGSSGYSQKNSPILMIGDKVNEAVLVKLNKDRTSMVGAEVVDKDLRDGWANVILKRQTVVNLLEAELEKVRYTVNPAVHTDTVKLAERSNAKLLWERVLYRYELT